MKKNISVRPNLVSKAWMLLVILLFIFMAFIALKQIYQTIFIDSISNKIFSFSEGVIFLSVEIFAIILYTMYITYKFNICDDYIMFSSIIINKSFHISEITEIKMAIKIIFAPKPLMIYFRDERLFIYDAQFSSRGLQRIEAIIACRQRQLRREQDRGPYA